MKLHMGRAPKWNKICHDIQQGIRKIFVLFNFNLTAQQLCCQNSWNSFVYIFSPLAEKWSSHSRLIKGSVLALERKRSYRHMGNRLGRMSRWGDASIFTEALLIKAEIEFLRRMLCNNRRKNQWLYFFTSDWWEEFAITQTERENKAQAKHNERGRAREQEWKWVRQNSEMITQNRCRKRSIL